VKGYHDTRFTHDPRRDVLWQTLCESVFQQMVEPGACVVELGAGYCHFINHIRAARRIALDQWQGAAEYANEGVEFHAGHVTDLEFLEDGSVDFVFASNLFEHLTQAELATVLDGLRPKLKKNGTLNILQPNYRFAANEYFDDYTHVSIWSDRSLADFLIAHGYEIIDNRPRFLPLTVKSRLPVSPLLIRLYLALPWKPLGKQMLLRATPVRG
jgi:hypothetical protein